ncbi:hypothetical protein PTI98_012292 [Pleurotus ostreatus]|nr:hypothetical protein PTI98_012292 [Pleurotus ostreatus]
MLRGHQDEICAYTAADPTPTEAGEHEDGTSSNGTPYVIEENPTVGMRMIANKDFECGDLILQERPLVLFPLEVALPAKSDLQLSLQRALNALDHAKRADYMGLPNIYATDEFEPVLGIFMSNKFEFFSTDDAAASADRTKPFAAVFKDISHINHRIACTCPACTNSESDANRVRIQNIQDNLAPVIQWALTPALPDDLLLVPSLEQLKLIEDEGLEGTEYYARVLRRLWYIYFVLDDFGASGFYGRVLRAWKITNGTKRSDVIKEMQSELELIQYAVNRRRLFMPRKAKLVRPVS